MKWVEEKNRIWKKVAPLMPRWIKSGIGRYSLSVQWVCWYSMFSFFSADVRYILSSAIPFWRVSFLARRVACASLALIKFLPSSFLSWYCILVWTLFPIICIDWFEQKIISVNFFRTNAIWEEGKVFIYSYENRLHEMAEFFEGYSSSTIFLYFFDTYIDSDMIQ